ncbi:RNA-binding S4 domain-containing protein [Corynebacterium uterequi]|uniref:Uncharacterized protein n=1 Tax=Corynebacterium uterequi TaxID=1072256 RepID=A0A0G3H9T9_9CORY|nr:RNA-binding S4 domain-containing protein [Corynebacterium uterequi]AKK10104.1 hypothetical protein CUTER_00375 [Corynebacterium uterequi]
MAQRIAVSGGSIKLGQFIKLANLVETGGQAKELIASGAVTVDGAVETRRGRTLRGEEEVCVEGLSAVVDTSGTAEADYFDEATANDDFDPEKWRNL